MGNNEQTRDHFWQAFKDPKFVVTLLSVVATAAIAYYRLGAVEDNLDQCEQKFTKLIQQEKQRAEQREKDVELRLESLEKSEFTVEDYYRNMESYDKELSRREDWMKDQNEFRIQMVQFAAESGAAIKELRRLIEAMEKKNQQNN